jgi:pSer/pThr/pTyr-binding forkhead associated (FHA) protein
VSGPLKGTCVDLSADPIVIGRDPKVSNLIIPLSNISRKHCTLKFVNGNVLMEDNGSVNGTFLSDGQRLTSGITYKLKAGDRFFLADREVLFEIRLIEPH